MKKERKVELKSKEIFALSLTLEVGEQIFKGKPAGDLFKIAHDMLLKAHNVK